VVTGRDVSKLDDHRASDRVLVLKLDVTQPDQVVEAVTAAEARFGGIDVLVNNAGIGYLAAIEEGDAAEVRRMFEVNVFGLTGMIQAVLPGMRRRRSGCIVNLSSLAGLGGMPALGQ
jgi:NAD(P)-dependent dehydrogenase (short-subunit alcohol dehydrogenase family)